MDRDQGWFSGISDAVIPHPKVFFVPSFPTAGRLWFVMINRRGDVIGPVIRGGFLWEKVGFDGTYNWKGT
jgi:hypothetical protein